MWGLIFVSVVLLFNPGVDVSPSHTPMLAFAMGGLALVASWFAALMRTFPVRSL